MMPEMDGIELCNRIKSNINLCYIPVVILTAKTSIESKLEGLRVGADAYINKPFLIEELEMRLSNIIRFRNVVKSKFIEIAKIEGLELPVQNKDQAFVEKIYFVVDNGLENREMNVQFVAEELNISRTSLHNKIKKVLGISTTEFINTIRINKAKNYIRSTEITFSEIAYKVGFNDPAYFNRIFKKHSGMTPGQYKSKIEIDKDN